MEKIRKDFDEWEATPSGIFIRARNITDVFSYSKMRSLHVRQKAEKIEELFSRCKLVIPKNIYLSKIIDNAKNMWSNHFLNQLEKK